MSLYLLPYIFLKPGALRAFLILNHHKEVDVVPNVVLLSDVLPPPFAPAITSPYSVSNR